jgi:hypothetical protein
MGYCRRDSQADYESVITNRLDVFSAKDGVIVSWPTRSALRFDECANALAAAVLLATRLEQEHTELRRAVERAALTLSKLKPEGK